MKYEKIFANHIFDKRSILQIYKELFQVNNNKTNNTVFLFGPRPLVFLQNDLQMSNKAYEKLLNSTDH